MQKQTLILAASGTGKTTTAAECKNVVDIDTIDYMFKYNQKLYGKLSSEELKNLVNNWLVNPKAFSKGSIKLKKFSGSLNFFFAVKKALKKNTVLIPLIPDTFSGMQNILKKTRKIVVVPEKGTITEYIERFKERGNDENFIKVRQEEHTKIWEMLDEGKHSYETIVLQKGEYLADAIAKINI